MKKLIEEEEKGKQEEHSGTNNHSTTGNIKSMNDITSMNIDTTVIEGSTKAVNESLSSILANPDRIVIVTNDNNESLDGKKRSIIKQYKKKKNHGIHRLVHVVPLP